ncbi:HNH endonuclease [Streptomyces sp900116325]|uniref:HNH endonuclease signature motif containing protein n=1 Tax=Streptomyces sp. 900116325 TaxID=3154295 RepID=UPI0033AE618D
MAKTNCKICDAEHYAHGWCKPHYNRWWRYGDPTHTPHRPTAEERFWSKVNKTPTCWLWTGPSRSGYGLFAWGSAKTLKGHCAHRHAYELVRGAIPEGKVLDHLCRIPLCVNPDHLEPVTLGENVLRGIGTSAINKRKTHCVNGHEFTPENTRIGKTGHRACRACDRENARRRLKDSGRQPVSESAKARMRKAVEEYSEASTAEIAAMLGWSEGHTRRVKSAVYGTVDRTRKTCTAGDCGRPAVARELCNTHYTRWRKHGDPNFEQPPTPAFCKIDGCGRSHRARGLCKSHYRRLRIEETRTA